MIKKFVVEGSAMLAGLGLALWAIGKLEDKALNRK